MNVQSTFRRIYRLREAEVTLVEDAYDVLGAEPPRHVTGDSVLKGWGHVRWFIERYPPELRERAVRMVARSAVSTIRRAATVRPPVYLVLAARRRCVRVRQAQVDAGARPGTRPKNPS